MPSRTPTPDPPTASGQRTSPESPASFGLRLITVPSGWPPYDCETHGAACPRRARPPWLNRTSVTGCKPWRGHPSRPRQVRYRATARRATAVPPGASGPGRGGLGSQGAAGRSVALSRQYAQVIVEILAGSRPLRQTVGWTTDHVRAQIGDLTRLLASDQRPRIRRVVTSQPGGFRGGDDGRRQLRHAVAGAGHAL